jgi:hypothetical protein
MKKTFKVIPLVIILLAILVFSYFFLSFNGGLGGWLSGLKRAPDWNSSDIAQARNKTKDSIASMQTSIQNRMNFNSHGSTFNDQCVKGDHDWKRNDPYAYRCTYRLTNFYSFNTDFRNTMLELESVLVSNGWQGTWQNDPKSISKMIREYYDDKENTNYGRTGLVSSLPSVDFYQIYGSNNLHIEYAQRETGNLDQISYVFSSPNYNQVYSQKSPVDLQSLFKTATKTDKYFLTISVEQEYFEN